MQCWRSCRSALLILQSVGPLKPNQLLSSPPLPFLKGPCTAAPCCYRDERSTITNEIWTFQKVKVTSAQILSRVKSCSDSKATGKGSSENGTVRKNRKEWEMIGQRGLWVVLKTKNASHIALEEGSSTSMKKDCYFSEYTDGWTWHLQQHKGRSLQQSVRYSVLQRIAYTG